MIKDGDERECIGCRKKYILDKDFMLFNGMLFDESHYFYCKKCLYPPSLMEPRKTKFEGDLKND